ICVSTHLPGYQIGPMLEDYPFDGVLLGYSAMNFAYREVGLDAAAKLKIGVAVMNPLGGGLIPQNPEIFKFVKSREDETAAQGALRFLLNDSRINVVLVGFSNEQQIEQAITAVNGYKPISPETVEKIRSGIKKSFNQLCTGCQYCDKCPEGIAVPRMMDTYNHKMFTGKDSSIIDRFYWHWSIDLENNYLDKCTQCGICEAACTQRLPIRERLKEMREIVDAHVAQKKKNNLPPNEP
ncbi:MAG: aldo/keto reductase, partial [Phycisphaerae bacterium]